MPQSQMTYQMNEFLKRYKPSAITNEIYITHTILYILNKLNPWLVILITTEETGIDDFTGEFISHTYICNDSNSP